MKNERYTFTRILWVVLACNAVFLVLSVIIMASASSLTQPFSWSHFFTTRKIIDQVVGIFVTTAFFYYTLNYFNQLITERKTAFHYLPPVLFSVVLMLVYNLISYYSLENKVESGGKQKITSLLLVIGFSISAIFFIALSLVIAWFNSLKDEKRQRKILEQQKMELEVEKSQANLNFLKAQINPHFLHNTLNFLYAKALPLSDELSEGILTLSDIMRYALGDGNTVNGKALLKEEIEHVQNVIKINQLRFSNNLNVNFMVEGVVNGARIIPFVLITLVENAFKHGDLKSTEQPIDIRIVVDDKNLSFFCRNKKKTGLKELSTGLGLDNIKKRLDLAYGSQYSFTIKDEIDFYTTELTINNL